jgi:tetratricopeptide (TPR) repeat protein
LGQACAAACDYDKSILLLDEAIVAKRQRHKSNRPAVGFAYTLACKASVLGDRGRFEETYQCFDEALASVQGAAHEVEGSILCWRSGVSLWQGRWDEARQCAQDAQRRPRAPCSSHRECRDRRRWSDRSRSDAASATLDSGGNSA